jgi:hypothetical protein
VEVAFPHHPGDALAVHAAPRTPQFGGDPRDAVGLAGSDVQHGDLAGERVVSHLAGPAGGFAVTPGVGGAGDCHRTARKGDGMVGLLRVDEPVQLAPLREGGGRFLQDLGRLPLFGVLPRSCRSSSRSALAGLRGRLRRGRSARAAPGGADSPGRRGAPGPPRSRSCRRSGRARWRPACTPSSTASCTCFPPGTVSSGISRPGLQVSTTEGKPHTRAGPADPQEQPSTGRAARPVPGPGRTTLTVPH